MDNLNLKIDMPSGPLEPLVLRQGKAPDLLPNHEPVIVSLTGTITAPGDFFANRKSLIDQTRSHVVANMLSGSIKLRINETDHFATTITGSLQINPELARLTINKQKVYSNRELFDLLKFSGPWFEDKDKHTQLLSKLQQFEATVTTEFTNANDLKGASAYKRITKIGTELGLDFNITLPIFVGQPPLRMKVDICMDAIDGSVRFWLESVDLSNNQMTEPIKILEEQLGRFEEIIVIRQFV